MRSFDGPSSFKKQKSKFIAADKDDRSKELQRHQLPFM